MYLYEKNSLGRYRQGVNVGYLVAMASGIVHELTHHVQFRRGPEFNKLNVSYSELETTANELEFLKVNFPEEYRLVMIEET